MGPAGRVLGRLLDGDAGGGACLLQLEGIGRRSGTAAAGVVVALTVMSAMQYCNTFARRAVWRDIIGQSKAAIEHRGSPCKEISPTRNLLAGSFLSEFLRGCEKKVISLRTVDVPFLEDNSALLPFSPRHLFLGEKIRFLR